MKIRKNIWKVLFCLGLVVGFSSNSNASQARFTNLNWWKIWPGTVKSTLTYDQQTDALELKGSEATTIYQWVEMEPISVYRITFLYKADVENNQAGASLGLNFRGTDAAAKELKTLRFPLNLQTGADQWQKFSCTFVTPAEPKQTTQFMFSHDAGINLLSIKDLQLIKEAPVTVSKSAVSSKVLSPDSTVWKTAPALSDFWNAELKGEPASQKTDVQLTWDDEALYVLFTNYEPNITLLNKSQTKRDGSIWDDDSDEVYIATPGNKAFQFITGAADGKWDGTLIQKVDGDPYTADSKWNGEWDSDVKIDGDRWTTAWRIPFATLGEFPKDGQTWRINFARHRYAGNVRQSSRWTYADGNTNEVGHFGYLRFDGNAAQAERLVQPIELHPLQINRSDATFAQVLGAAAGNYHTEDWSHDFFLSSYPKSFQEKYTKESWQKEMEAKLTQRGENGSYGPFLPGSYNAAGWPILLAAHEKYGMLFPYTMTTSGNDKIAMDNGAKYFDPTPQGAAQGRVVEFDPEKRKSIFAVLDTFLQRNPDKKNLIAYFYVVDEPSNSMFAAFSRTRRPDAGKILDAVDAEIRANYGGGKYGLYDDFASENKNSPYERIAFVKWWNAQMDDWGKQVRQGLKERAPEIPVLLANHNTVSGAPFVDVPLLSRYSDLVSVDPYPTATLAAQGRARALYHTGFSTKWMHDLSGGKDTTTIAQGFVYHGTAPSPDDVREWASQALKNGADTLSWYAAGPAPITIPDTWVEMNVINKQVGKLNGIVFPTTRTAIFHSLISQAGLNDKFLNSAYTVYSLLGEQIGSWFQFVGDGAHAQDLSKFDLFYVPSATYLSKESAQSLLARAKQGATIVFFDPLSLTQTGLGESLSELRTQMIGGTLGAQRKAVQLKVKANIIPELPQETTLPLTPMAQGPQRGNVLAYDIEPPKDAKVFALYNDGRPAAYSRTVGKGRVIYFGAQPFGNADLAVTNSSWQTLMRGLAKDIKEPVDLPIWDFYLKK